MAFRIEIAGPARQDAREYAAYVRNEQNSPAAARRWLAGLVTAIKDLAELPQRFSIIPEAEELGSPYRAFRYHSHRVIYTVREAEQLVIVHRIYHGARKNLDNDDVR